MSLEQLYKLYSEKLVKQGISLGLSEEDAEDKVHNTLVNLIEANFDENDNEWYLTHTFAL